MVYTNTSFFFFFVFCFVYFLTQKDVQKLVGLDFAFLVFILRGHKKTAIAQPSPRHSRQRAGEKHHVSGYRRKQMLFPERHIRLPLLFHQLQLHHVSNTNWKLARKKLEMVTWLATQECLPQLLNQSNCVSSLCKHCTRCLSSHLVNKQSLIESLLCAWHYVHVMEATEINQVQYYLQRTKPNKKYNICNMAYIT